MEQEVHDFCSTDHQLPVPAAEEEPTETQQITHVITEQSEKEELSTPNAEEADEQLSTQNIFDEETLQYVLGSFIRRLDCKDCSEKIGSLHGKNDSSGFTHAMTYERGHLFKPSQTLLLTFSPMVKPILKFYKDNLCIRNITATAVEKFAVRYEKVGCCCQQHLDKLLLFFCQMLIRVVCKELNNNFKQKSRPKEKKNIMKYKCNVDYYKFQTLHANTQILKCTCSACHV